MDEYILELRDITKKFLENTVLNKVNFNLKSGEVHSIIGENGVGKSTLMKIIMGIYAKDEGAVYLYGNEVNITNPKQAQEFGISMIYQEASMIPDLDIAKNVFVGREPVKKKFGLKIVDSKKMYENTKKLLDMIHLDIDPRTLVKYLGRSQQQVIEIIKALSRNAGIIIMDEPTESLSEPEISLFFRIIKDIKETGVSIVFISHRLDEVIRVSDRITIMRDGAVVDVLDVRNIELKSVISKMMGRDLSEGYPRLEISTGKELLKVNGLSSSGLLNNISFSIRKGEIIGLTGLTGSGRSLLASSIFGINKIDSGEIFVEGRRVRLRSSIDAIKAGISYITEDRMGKGLYEAFPVDENITFTKLKKIMKLIFLNNRIMEKISSIYIKQLGIRVVDMKQKTEYLSGGSQQKVMFAKWLNSDAKVFIMDEPTRSIDIASKVDIYNILNELKRKGAGIMFISSNLPELIGMCDRIFVMYKGTIIKQLSGEEATKENIVFYANGGVA